METDVAGIVRTEMRIDQKNTRAGGWYLFSLVVLFGMCNMLSRTGEDTRSGTIWKHTLGFRSFDGHFSLSAPHDGSILFVCGSAPDGWEILQGQPGR